MARLAKGEGRICFDLFEAGRLTMNRIRMVMEGFLLVGFLRFSLTVDIF